MGYELRRWLAERLPPRVSSGERLVALEVADQANEQTRRAYGKDMLQTVIRRTGFADEKQLGKVLGKLAANGVELRVPVRDKQGQEVTDKRGRVLFACKGHALEFYVPRAEECPALKVPGMGDLEATPVGGPSTNEGAPDGGPSTPEAPLLGAASPHEAPPPGPKAPPPGPKAPPNGGPISSDLLRSPHLSLEGDPTAPQEREKINDSNGLEARLMAAHNASRDEVTAVLDAVRREGTIRSLAAWATSDTGRVDFAQRLDKHRRSADAPTAELPPMCDDPRHDPLDPHRRLLDDEDRSIGPCPVCSTPRLIGA